MQQEIRLATFNVLNLAPPGMRTYDNFTPYTRAEYEAKTSWLARQMDLMNADIIGFQEIFSQAALQDVLAKTQLYKDAYHAGFDPDPHAPKLTPNVALVSRFPLIQEAKSVAHFTHDLCMSLPGDAGDVIDLGLDHFTRPVLHAQICVSDTLVLNVFVVHLKSKRPDFIGDENEADSYQHGLAHLRSLVRRGTEALGLRYLLSDFVKTNHQPLVVMGDFNDVVDAVTTQIVMNGGRDNNPTPDGRLFDCYHIQQQRNTLRNLGYSVIHDGRYETIDHILVSQEFNPRSGSPLGEVLEVIYLNDHLALQLPQASDHGQVIARIRLNLLEADSI